MSPVPPVAVGPAELGDDAAIRRLLRDSTLPGAITLGFEREPDYFHGTGLAGAEEHTLVARTGSGLLGLGRVVVRPCWVNGAVARVGYLGELRLAPTAQGEAALVRRGFAAFRDRLRANPPLLCFTSIAEDNLRARRLLERGLTGWPRYEFLTRFVTVVLPARRLRAPPHGIAAPARLEEVADFFLREGSRANLATAWTPAALHALARHGLGAGDFFAAREGRGLVAAAGLWDQRSFRQTVIRGYAGWLGALRPLFNLASRLGGWPTLPAPGAVLAQAFASPLVAAPDAVDRLPALLATLGDAAARRGLTHLTLGFPAGDARLETIQRSYRSRTYVTRLYRVHWPDADPGPALDSRPIVPDIALL